MYVSQLKRGKNGRIFLLGTELKCGDRLIVLVYNGLTYKAEWIDTTVQMTDFGFCYLTGIWGYQVDGLFATFCIGDNDAR